jgi:hypothetical protein
MLRAAAVVLCVIGLTAIGVLAAVLGWGFHHRGIGLSDQSTPILMVIAVVGLGCLAGGLKLLRGPRSS